MNKELLEKLRNYLLEVVAEYENEGVELSINEMHVYIQGTSEYDCPVVIYVNGEYVELPSENFEDNNIVVECFIFGAEVFESSKTKEDAVKVLKSISAKAESSFENAPAKRTSRKSILESASNRVLEQKNESKSSNEDISIASSILRRGF
jgi:hypothetical protein